MWSTEWDCWFDLVQFNAALSYVVIPLVNNDWRVTIGLAGVRTQNHLINSTRCYWQTIPNDDWIKKCLFFTHLQLTFIGKKACRVRIRNNNQWLNRSRCCQQQAMLNQRLKCNMPKIIEHLVYTTWSPTWGGLCI